MAIDSKNVDLLHLLLSHEFNFLWRYNHIRQVLVMMRGEDWEEGIKVMS